MNINKKYKLFALVLFTIFCFSGIATAQTNDIEIAGKVIDEQGKPLSEVTIYGPKGTKTSTNSSGEFNITLPSDQNVVVEKKGYKSQLLSISGLTENITLQKSAFLDSEDDQINMGVSVRSRREMVGSASSTNTADRLVYDNTQNVRDYIAGLTVGVRGSDNIRGIGNALFVIDGVFGRDPNILNMEEVDQITVLKDANAVALYGSQARDGVIIINTKRGKINKKATNVNVRTGYRVPISLPNYLNAGNLMALNNEARINDGIPADDTSLFSAERIANTRSGENPIEFPDVDLYDFVEPFVNTTNAIAEFTGGNEKSQYYVNVGWLFNDAWVDINESVNAGTNRFNVRGNIDFKVNDWITSSIDAVAIISTSKGSRANIFNAATTFIPFDYAPLIPFNNATINAEGNQELQELLAGAITYNGNLLGTSQQAQGNAPIALAIAGGFQDNVFRSTQFNNAVNFDLSAITKGLSAKTYLSFDFFDRYTTSIRNQFRTYAPRWENNRIVAFDDGNGTETVYGQDLRDLSENVNSNGFVSRVGMYGLVNYKNTFANNHSINSTLLAYYNSEKRDGVLQINKDAHLGFQMTYDYKKKLYVDFSGAYLHSIKLAEGNRGGLSPTVGLGYILSEEDFLKDNSFVNYLKVKSSWGIIKSDIGIGGYYLYDENYSAGGGFAWADGLQSNRRQNITQGANPNFGFEERIDLNIGLEAYLMNSLWIEANYFRSERDKQQTRIVDQYPSYYGTFRPFDNFNANLYTGFELGVNFNKNIKDLSISIGANLLYSQTERSKLSEVFEFDYQQRQGREVSTIFGFQDLGFYSPSDFQPEAGATDGSLATDENGNFILVDGLAVPNFGSVQPGDIKYQDQNNDNIIDQNDRVDLGQSASPISYGVNLNLKYKSFNLFVLGTGQSGALGNKLSGRFNNYYAPNGNDKYSEVVLGRWTPETASTATFPRLSASQNRNNFQTSSFWLYDNTFFRINRAQLTYEFNDIVSSKLGADHFSINLQGTNLLEISDSKDIRQLNIGSAPQFRTYTFGIRMSF